MKWEKGASILCLGCGDGYEVEYFKKLGYKNVVGVTNDVVELSVAKAEMITQSDMHDMQFLDKSFDYVYSKETLEHSIAPYAVLSELYRISTKGFLHFISTGIDKQREHYHFSCFPDWVWYDLFKKTGHRVTKILENKVELGFAGTIEPNFQSPIPLYSLIREVEAVKKEPLLL